MQRHRGRGWRCAAGAMLLVAASCGRTEFGGAGSITADGSSTVFPITQAVAEEFNRAAPEIRISVGVSGTGGGFEKFCRGETDLSNASRPIDRAEEVPLCQRNGIESLELEVAVDGLSVAVNPDNGFATCLTTEELRRIWEPGSGVRSWSDVRPEFPDEPLVLYGPGTDSGTFEFFTEVIVGEDGASRIDYTASEDDNVLVQGVAGDPGALGYFGFAYLEQNQDLLRAVAVDGGEGCVLPTPETIATNEYRPLSRPLYVYVSDRAVRRPEVRRFVTFYLENVRGLLPSVGYVPMPADRFAEEREQWRKFSAST